MIRWWNSKSQYPFRNQESGDQKKKKLWNVRISIIITKEIYAGWSDNVGSAVDRPASFSPGSALTISISLAYLRVL